MDDIFKTLYEAAGYIGTFLILRFYIYVLQKRKLNRPQGLKRNIEAIIQCIGFAFPCLFAGYFIVGLVLLHATPIGIFSASVILGLLYIYVYKEDTLEQDTSSEYH